MAGMFVRYYLELPLAAARVEQTLVDAAPGWLASLSTAAQERKDFLDRLGHAIVLSHLGPAARMTP